MTNDLKYRVLADELEKAIRSGRLAVGSRLPSVRKLMAQRRLSLATVVTALQKLEEGGLVAARAKSGYFVISKGGSSSRTLSEAPMDTRGEPSRGSRLNGDGPDPDLFPRQRLNRIAASVLRRHPHIATHYAHGLGLLKLRREIARRSADFGSFSRPEELVITNGATEALALAVRATTRPGDSVALQSPAHPLVLSVLKALHVNVVELPALAGSGLSLDSLDQAKVSNPGLRTCLLVPNFHPPTGILMSVAAKRDLLAYADRTDLAIIENDVYGELQHEGPRPPPLKAFDESGRVLYVTSYSKTIAPGMLVGWIAGGRWQTLIEASKSAGAVATAEFPQLVLHEYLSRGGHLPHLRRLRHALKERVLRVHDVLTRTLPQGCRWTLPEGGYFLWLELPPGTSADELLTQPTLARLALVSGGRCTTQKLYGHCLRLNVSLLDEGMAADIGAAISRSLDKAP